MFSVKTDRYKQWQKMNILGIYRGYHEKKFKIDRQLPCMHLMVLAHTLILVRFYKQNFDQGYKFRKGNNHIFMLKIVQHEVVD